MGSTSSKLERKELITFADLTEFVEKRVRVRRSFLGQLSASSVEKTKKRIVKFQDSKGKAMVHSANLSNSQVVEAQKLAEPAKKYRKAEFLIFGGELYVHTPKKSFTLNYHEKIF